MPRLRTLVAPLALTLASCAPASSPAPAPAPAPARTKWVVVAPHPDDEALVASGVLFRATAAREPVAVIVLTSGDYDCVVDGARRQAESLRGLALLGVPEGRVHFLGYPDGALPRLGRAPLTVRRVVGGECVEGSATYGTRRPPAPYTRASVVAELGALLAELAPEEIAVTHPMDTHPDHAATYAIVRDAAAALTGRLAGYTPRERLPVPEACPKFRAIAAHSSQTHDSLESYLFAFVRGDEPFFPETLGGPPQPTTTFAVPRPAGATVLDAPPYRLEIAPDRVRLRRADGVEIHGWPLPHDLWREGVESFSVGRRFVREDGVEEISVRVGGALVGVAVDIAPHGR